MPDLHDQQTRSRNMAAIKGKNTKPEMLIRKALFRRGFRYRLHDKRLPSKPDIVLPRYKTVIFVHGCFWHGHDCSLFKIPKTRTEFWMSKIAANRERDLSNVAQLKATGWRLVVIWECALKGKRKTLPDNLGQKIAAKLLSSDQDFDFDENTAI